MKRLSLIALVYILLSFALPVYAADNLKVGVINLDMVLQKSPLAVSYNDQISKEFKPRQDELNAAQKNLQGLLDQLTYNGFQMKEADRNALRTKINDQKRDFDKLNASLQQDLAAAQAKYTQQLMGKLTIVINKIAKDGNYSIIQSTANLLYLNSSLDVTDQVISQLKE